MCHTHPDHTKKPSQAWWITTSMHEISTPRCGITGVASSDLKPWCDETTCSTTAHQ
ncbi:MAG: hypothetical protein LUQ50_15560 [Methanospirillum sp.]|uniref:hypothetical protein n=1 Tax=Methanospirillum sp. TaxID=45200 RepID=UPI00236FB5E1|nr:hypothetical protein [Methanospirillum sp.]MDD1730471.1 hypothetical protein [Methanospirillum sp.]